jgi:hypothetical protein
MFTVRVEGRDDGGMPGGQLSVRVADRIDIPQVALGMFARCDLNRAYGLPDH